MTSTARTSALGICFLVLASATCALASDWPQWRGPNRDGKLSDFKAPQSWPAQLTQKWKATVGAGDATPALVGGKLFVFTRQGADEVTQCINAENGSVIWQDKYAPGVTVTGPAGSHPGPRSSPAVSDGKVVTLGVNGVLSCLDAAGGKVLWRKQQAQDIPSGNPRFFAASSPMIVDGLCIAQLGGGGDGAAVVALDLASGEVKWKAQTSGTAYASPALLTAQGSKQVVAQTDKSLIGLSLADGKVLWQVDTPAQRMAQNAVSPLIDANTIIYSGQGNGTHAIAVEKKGDGFTTKDLWTNDQVGEVFSTPILKEGRIFGLSDKASFFCLDAKTGKTLWTSPKRQGERGFGSIVDAGSVVLALTPKSELIAFKPDEKEFQPVATIPLSDAQPYAYPVVSGTMIVVKGQDSMTAYSIE